MDHPHASKANRLIHVAAITGTATLKTMTAFPFVPVTAYPYLYTACYTAGGVLAVSTTNIIINGHSVLRGYFVPYSQHKSCRALRTIPPYLAVTVGSQAALGKPLTAIEAAGVIFGGAIAAIVLKRNAKRSHRRKINDLKAIFS